MLEIKKNRVPNGISRSESIYGKAGSILTTKVIVLKDTCILERIYV